MNKNASAAVKPLPQVKVVPIDQLVPYDRNPRFNDEAVDAVAASLREFGWKQPIVIGPDNVIVAGHTRLKAALKLGLKEAPCVLADDLTPAQLRAYRLVDNKTNELSVWDDLALDAEIDALPEFDFKAFGFNYGSADDLAKELDASLDDSDLDVDLTTLGRVIIRLPTEQAAAVNGWRKVNGDAEIVAFLLQKAGLTPKGGNSTPKPGEAVDGPSAATESALSDEDEPPHDL